jgi:diguanylate cyclase (GGDEF)-like protein
MLSHINPATASPRRTVVAATLFVVFVCLALLAIDAWLALRARDQEIRQATVANTNLAAAVSQQMDSMFSEVGNILGGITYELERSDIDATSLGRLQPVLVNQATVTQHIHDLFVYDAQGAWLVTSQARIPASANNADREYFIHHRSNPSLATFVGKPVVSRSTGVWVIPVSKRFNDSEGRFAGVVLATIKVDYVSRLISEFEIGRHGALAVSRNDGTILVRRPFAVEDLGKTIAGSEIYRASMQQSRGTLQTISPLDGVERLVSYRHMNSHQMLVAVAVSKQEMLQNWRATTSFQTGWILALCLITGLAGAHVVRSVRERLKVELSLGRTRDELTRANARLSELARHDGLTALANRRYFDEMLDIAWAQAARSQQPLALVMIDVDHFKRYNDLYGHLQGDQCLQKVAQAVQSAARRPRDFVARYGGEEMAMILPDTDARGAAVVAEAARKAVADLRLPSAGSVNAFVSISAGVAVHLRGQDRQSPQALLREADSALYAAKEAGRNAVVVHESPCTSDASAA